MIIEYQVLSGYTTSTNLESISEKFSDGTEENRIEIYFW